MPNIRLLMPALRRVEGVIKDTSSYWEICQAKIKYLYITREKCVQLLHLVHGENCTLGD